MDSEQPHREMRMEPVRPMLYAPGPAPPPYSHPYRVSISLAPAGLHGASSAFSDSASPVSRMAPLPTPSDSSNSPTESADEGEQTAVCQPDAVVNRMIFRPVDFDRYAEGPDSAVSGAFTYYPPTPTDSEEDGSPAHVGGITAQLVDKKLWQAFGEIGNEMIVTKPGRRLFPSVLVSLSGLDPRVEYNIYLRIVSADKYRYKFLGSQWVAMAESEIMQSEEKQIVQHPNSPNVGSFWMRKPISFKALKITHHSKTSSKPKKGTMGTILLHTMHKYSIEVVVQPVEVELSSAFVVPIPDTTFVAVTSYQNTKLTQLKIDNNPFAKGFRDRESAMAMPPYPGHPLWQMPHLPPPIPYPGLSSFSGYQPPPSAHSPITTPSSLPSLVQAFPNTSLSLTTPSPSSSSRLPLPSMLPPLSHPSLHPRLPRDSESSSGDETPTVPPYLPPYPLPPLPMIPTYPHTWAPPPWSSQPPPPARSPHSGCGYTTDCSDE